MAFTETREIVIDATPDEVMAVLFDLESLTEWPSAHQQVDVRKRDNDGIRTGPARSSGSWASTMSRSWTTPCTAKV
jgi:uncharacterized protein YndB with AHSA1/START domain